MIDYKMMYLTMARETEKAVRILIEAQMACEEHYMQGEETSVFVLPQETKKQEP